MILFFCLLVVLHSVAAYDSVEISTVEVLTFHKDRYTLTKKAAPIPQLDCVGGDGCRYSDFVKVVQCYNMGVNDRGEIQWRCEADVDSRLSLGKVDVDCEGANGPGDRYVIAGSCGLEYSLYLTEEGHRHPPSLRKDDYNYDNSGDSNWGFFVFLGIIASFCCCGYCCRKVRDGNTYVSIDPSAPPIDMIGVPVATTVASFPPAYGAYPGVGYNPYPSVNLTENYFGGNYGYSHHGYGHSDYGSNYSNHHSGHHNNQGSSHHTVGYGGTHTR